MLCLAWHVSTSLFREERLADLGLPQATGECLLVSPNPAPSLAERGGQRFLVDPADLDEVEGEQAAAPRRGSWTSAPWVMSDQAWFEVHLPQTFCRSVSPTGT
ncbi:MAG: hypothetical protein ACRDZ4_23115 [Egibacteraceae bacterium]